MLQAFALQTVVSKMGYQAQLINFSNRGQRLLYHPFQRGLNPKTVIKNMIALLHHRQLQRNAICYEAFISKNFKLGDGDWSEYNQLTDDGYDAVICGSDQVWNVTIDDSDDAYFLPWVTKAKKIAYATSFGARNIAKHSRHPQKYASYIKAFDSVSIRENNGRKWIREFTGLEVPVVLDPTLLLDADDYDSVEDATVSIPDKYIFYYSPNYDRDINKLVKQISDKYRLPVICFNTKAFFVKGMDTLGFSLPEREDPSVYLHLMKNASLIITTSFHGTIFSTMYEKPFWTVKNGSMFEDDDRVLTLMDSLDLKDRLTPISFDPNKDYLAKKDYSAYRRLRHELREISFAFLRKALEDD
jgi:hypothetical protein